VHAIKVSGGGGGAGYRGTPNFLPFTFKPLNAQYFY